MTEEEAANVAAQPEETDGDEHAKETAEAPYQAELLEKASKAEEYLSSLQRLKADFDNYRKRMLQEQVRWGDAAVGAFIAEIFPVIDNLERALAAGGDAARIRQGVELTLRQLHELLAKAGVEPVVAVGRPFDPAFHEAMLQVETTEYPDGHIVEELRKGYLYKRQVLRPAMVKVARTAQAAEGEGAR